MVPAPWLAREPKNAIRRWLARKNRSARYTESRRELVPARFFANARLIFWFYYASLRYNSLINATAVSSPLKTDSVIIQAALRRLRMKEDHIRISIKDRKHRRNNDIILIAQN